MTDEDLTIKLGLTGQQQVSGGLEDVAEKEKRVGEEAEKAGVKAKAMGAAFTSAGKTVGKTSSNSLGNGIGFLTQQAKYGAIGLGVLAAAGIKWGLGFNASVASARERFKLFTDDVDGLTAQVHQIDQQSAAFGFAQLADAAAMLGNADIKDVPDVLKGAANAAAASGRGVEGLQSIVLALSQIQSKGKVSMEEIQQLNEAGAPGTQKIIAKAFNLTADQVANLGAQGLDATKAVNALTTAWTSGKMAEAAANQAKTLGGQWAALTSNMQAGAGAATKGLADGLTREVLPAANRAVEEITRMLGDEGLSDRQKIQRAKNIIRTELGPIAKDLAREFHESGIGDELEGAFETAMNRMASVAISSAPHIVGQFVDAWLGAGPWAKLISGAWLAHKLGIDKGAFKLIQGLRGAGGNAGGTGLGALGGRGQIPLKPLYVWVVGEGVASVRDDLAGAGRETQAERSTRLGGRGGKLLTAIKAAPLFAAEVAPPVAAATALGLGFDAFAPNWLKDAIDKDLPSGPGGAALRREAARVSPAPGFGGGMPGLPPGGLNLTTTVNIDGEVAGRAVTRAQDHNLGRGK